MFRLFVGDLPPDCDEDKLFRSFNEKFRGVKKASVVRNDDNSSRKFGFVSFDEKADLDAALAQEMSIDGLRLKIDIAHPQRYDMNHRSDNRSRNNRYHNNNYSHHHHHGGVPHHHYLGNHRGPNPDSHGPNINKPNPSVSQRKSIQDPQAAQTQIPHQKRSAPTANNNASGPTISSPVAETVSAAANRPHAGGQPTSVADSSTSPTANSVIHPMPYMDPYGNIYDPMTGVPLAMGPAPMVGADMSAMGHYPPTSMSSGSASSPEMTGEMQGIPMSPVHMYYQQGAAAHPMAYGPPGASVGPPVMPQISQQNPSIQGPPGSRFNPTRSPATDMNNAGHPYSPQQLYYMNYWNGPPLYFDTGAQPGIYPQPFIAVRAPMPFNPANQHPFSS